MNDRELSVLGGERQLWSSSAEQSVLGALMLNNDTYDRIADAIAETDFFEHQHRVIYRAIAALLVRNEPADAVTVSNALAKTEDLDRAGGMEYVGALVANVPTAANIRHYATVVRERRIERDLYATASRLSELAYGREPLAERLAEAQSAVFALGDTSGGDDPVPISACLSAVIEQIETRYASDGTPVGIPTGLTELDRRLGGLNAGDQIIIAARTSVGKTALGMQIGVHNAIAGATVLVFSLEMDRNQLTQRALSNIGQIDGEKLRHGRLDTDDWERLSAALGRLSNAGLIIDDRVDLNVAQMRARARRVKRKHGLHLVIVDYLQLVRGDGDNRNEQVSGISRGLKLMARELSVPVIALSQLSRKVEDRTDKRPVLSDLRDSGAIEQDADVILFIYRDEVYNPDTMNKGIAEILIRKNRMGRTGDVATEFRGEFNEFRDTEWRRPPAEVRPMRKPRSFG